MSEHMMTEAQYSAAITTIASRRQPIPTLEQSIAAEITNALAHLVYLQSWAGPKLDACELSSLGAALSTLHELHDALTTSPDITRRSA
ncbi:MAG: hypothetical protein H0U59_10700 [Gemmatimonadaceae bacterium]|nr:hypothetical protein [Gemmatimonadaceae bacterium]